MLSVLLGNGWYKGRFGFNDPEREAYYGDEWKLIAEVHIEYKDGTKDAVSYTHLDVYKRQMKKCVR